MVMKKRAGIDANEPVWAADAAADSGVLTIEQEEEDLLAEDDRNQIDGFRELANDDRTVPGWNYCVTIAQRNRRRSHHCF